MSLRHILLAIAVSLVWGLSFIAIRWGVDEVPPLLLTAVRYVFAALPAVFFVRRPAVSWGLIVAYGFAIGVGQFGLLFLSIKLGMPAGLGSVVIQLQVFFTIFLAFVFFGERPGLAQLAGAGVALVGIAVIAMERLEGAALLPLLLMIGSALCWGLGNTVGKKAGRIDMLGYIVWSSLVSPLPLFLLSLLIEGPGAIPFALEHVTIRGIGSLVFMSYIATLFGYGAWAWLLSRYPAGQVTPFALFVPVAGIASAALFLGEAITPIEVAGSALVFAGLMLNIFRAAAVEAGERMIALRPATADDAGQIAEVFAVSRRLLTFLPDLHTIEEDRVFVRDHVLVDYRVTVAEREGRIVGFMAELEGWIEHLYIDAGQLRSGVGRMLIEAAQARNETLQLWCFADNLRGRAFYERMGFEAVKFTDGARNEARAPDIMYLWERDAVSG